MTDLQLLTPGNKIRDEEKAPLKKKECGNAFNSVQAHTLQNS